MADDGEMAGLAARAISIAETANRTQARIIAQQARSRRTVRLLAVSVVLDITLSVFCVGLALNQRAAAHSACVIGNQARAAQVQLWDHVIAVSVPPPHETAAHRAVRLRKLAGFRAYVARQFHQVSC